MTKIFALLTVIFLGGSVAAQNTATVKGKLIDSTSKQSLKDATVTVLDAQDSTLEVFGLAKADGSFSISNISFGERLLQIKFQGYALISRKISFSKTNASLDLGAIYMTPEAEDLGNVTVRQSVIQMKKDTLEMSASAFKTKPNAVAEDLLKKMPGMEVAKDGSIKSGGEAVQRILVNGKRFMGDDPKLATRNLPPDVIDKIQVFDDLSDQSKFSGFDDGNRVKTINITTRRDVRKGRFGKFVAGAGTDGVYDESMNLTNMNGDQQITLVGQGNNINKTNFSGRDILGGGARGGNFAGGGFGGGNRGGGGFGGGGASSSGITENWAGAVNYRDVWGKNVEVYGSYKYEKPHAAIETRSNIVNTVTPDSSTVNDQLSSSLNRTETHTFNFNMEARFDSMNSLIFRPNLTLQNSTPASSSSTSMIGGKNGVAINRSVNNTQSRSNGFNINGANLQLRHRFAKRGRTISLDLGFSAGHTNGEGYNYAINSFYQPFVKTDTINQFYVDSSRSFAFNPTLSYTEPLSRNSMLEFRYSYSYNENNSINKTYRFDNTSGKFSRFDSLFSNSYDYTANSNNANLSYRLQGTKFNFNIGTGLQFMSLLSNNTTKHVIVDRSFVNFTPTVNFMYNFSRTHALRVFYNGRTGQPSTAQLQPILTTSDSINFQQGNPNLKPQFTHSLRVLYNSFDPFTQRIIFATVNASMVQNDIQSSVVQAANGGKTTTYVNLNGTYNLQGTFMYGFPIKSPKSNLQFTTNLSYSQQQSLLTNAKYNSASSYSRSTQVSESIKWTTNLANHFDMNLNYTFMYNPVRNTLTPTQNSNYTTQTLGADFTLYSNNGWLLASDFDYTHYGNRAPGYNTTAFLVTPSIAKQFLKNKAGELRLTCFDIFKQNTSISSSISGTQNINTRTNTLTRYFLLTFTYNLRSLLGGQQQRGNMPPGMMPGMRMGGGNFGGGEFRRGGGG
ncbi:outer membrane beta-barrel family protein [Sediminibacterium soli]|uniref:outer membrane beta-barrel family protein n=1 Tax=Sediminibacterium soli TaxID=2698829 RepID=UPI00137B658F|nr:outer membrane beta-barrel family protein [Sediminibacterium soli]NCI47657.1 outer membrane beta-barrel protein [Sediminibacterium soli]